MLRDAASSLPVDGGLLVDGGRVAHARVGETCLHASCVELAGTGVVLLGPSGSGKSDLALRLIDAGGRLVADDRLVVERQGEQLIGRSPEAVAGLIEVRGLGIMRVEHCPSTPLGLVVELGDSTFWPRLPERLTSELLGIALPCIRLDPRAPSTCAKIKLALGGERVE
jgi:serine kinase of HPr protein (carbohydrate metabolism regulator)